MLVNPYALPVEWLEYLATHKLPQEFELKLGRFFREVDLAFADTEELSGSKLGGLVMTCRPTIMISIRMDADNKGLHSIIRDSTSAIDAIMEDILPLTVDWKIRWFSKSTEIEAAVLGEMRLGIAILGEE